MSQQNFGVKEISHTLERCTDCLENRFEVQHNGWICSYYHSNVLHIFHQDVARAQRYPPSWCVVSIGLMSIRYFLSLIGHKKLDRWKTLSVPLSSVSSLENFSRMLTPGVKMSEAYRLRERAHRCEQFHEAGKDYLWTLSRISEKPKPDENELRSEVSR